MAIRTNLKNHFFLLVPPIHVPYRIRVPTLIYPMTLSTLLRQIVDSQSDRHFLLALMQTSFIHGLYYLLSSSLSLDAQHNINDICCNSVRTRGAILALSLFMKTLTLYKCSLFCMFMDNHHPSVSDWNNLRGWLLVTL